MQQPNFTPGPWEVVNSDFFNDNADSSLVIRDGEDWEICHLCDGIRGDFETMAFNAALIAAASAMYAQIEKLVNALLVSGAKNYPIIDESYEVLARARGENPWQPCGEGENICNCKSPAECGYKNPRWNELLENPAT